MLFRSYDNDIKFTTNLNSIIRTVLNNNSIETLKFIIENYKIDKTSDYSQGIYINLVLGNLTIIKLLFI